MIRTLLGKKFPAPRWALSVGLGSSLLALGNASAQQVTNPTTSQAPETAAADRVVVTGSNIPSSEEVGTAPVDTVDQAARDRTGQEDVLTVLTESTPSISSGGGNLGQSNASINSGSTLGGSAVSIHGLQTLVLLDGRRLTDASAEAAGGGSFTDVNLFPSALVKRIEVLKDGASAIYGTEAVGGVVNVILDDEFQGFDISGRYGFTEKSDIHDDRISAIFGLGDDKTHIVVGAEYVEQDPIFDRDRPFAVPSFGTTTSAGIIRVAGSVYSLAPGLTSPSATNPSTGMASLTPLTNGTYTDLGTAGGGGAAAATTGFDLSRATSITLDQNRTNVYASADRQLFGDHVVAFGDFLYASNYSQSYLNAQPLNNAEGVVVPATAPFNPFGMTADGTTLTGASQFEVANRFVTNPRIFRQDTDFYRIVAGFKGVIIPNYNYEVALNESRDELSFKNYNLIDGPALNSAIAGGFDATGAPVVGGAYSMVNGNLQPALDFFSRSPSPASEVGVFGTDIRYFETKFAGVDGKITAFPYNLPAGPIGFAAGGEYRHESLKANVDPQDLFIGSVPIGNIDVGRDVTAGFGELQIPVIGPDMKVPLIYSLDLDGAVRFENYSTSQSTWVPKAGFVLRPIKDIALRGTFSKSFIAPTLYQTEGPSSNGFSSAVDLGAGSEQAQEEGGSNPALGNIRANTYTAGIVISPHQIEGLTLNCDFFHVEETNVIGGISDTLILQSVNTLGPASPFAGLVHLGGFTGPTVTGVNQLAGNLPNYFVVDNQQNLGGMRIGGVDFGAHYTHDFGKYGQANIGVDGTYYLQYKESSFQYSKFFDVIGLYTGQAGEVEQYHLTPEVSYSIAGFTASALGNYIPRARDAHEISVDPSVGGVDIDKPAQILAATGQDHLPIIRDYYTIDLLFSYEFNYHPPDAPVPAPKEGKDGKGGGDGKSVASTSKEMAHNMLSLKLLDGLKVAFGIDNVTNARPPFVFDSPDSSNTEASIYDPYQRRYYITISKKF